MAEDLGCPAESVYPTGMQVVKRWFHRVAEDPSALTFVEWNSKEGIDTADAEAPPAAMLVNSKELRGAGFELTEIMPPMLEGAARGRTRSAHVRATEGMGERKWGVCPRVDNKIREDCDS